MQQLQKLLIYRKLKLEKLKPDSGAFHTIRTGNKSNVQLPGPHWADINSCLVNCGICCNLVFVWKIITKTWWTM